MDYLDSLTNSSCLHNGYFNIINSLIHMHLNRLFGTDRRKELKLLTMVRHSIGYRIGVLRNMNMKEEVNR
ncbi:lantibiotic dehydratase C-terminal domain-containing protein [Cytobacillus sp. AMY 15.2]